MEKIISAIDWTNQNGPVEVEVLRYNEETNETWIKGEFVGYLYKYKPINELDTVISKIQSTINFGYILEEGKFTRTGLMQMHEILGKHQAKQFTSEDIDDYVQRLSNDINSRIVIYNFIHGFLSEHNLFKRT